MPDRPTVDLVVAAFDDERSASEAALEVARSGDSRIGADAVAVIVREGGGGYVVRTDHHALPTSLSWGMFWELLFAELFFVPVLGMPVGQGLGELTRRAGAVGAEPGFAERIRGLLQPGTSALFVVVERDGTDRAPEGAIMPGGSVVTTPLSARAVSRLQEQLHGAGG